MGKNPVFWHGDDGGVTRKLEGVVGGRVEGYADDGGRGVDRRHSLQFDVDRSMQGMRWWAVEVSVVVIRIEEYATVVREVKQRAGRKCWVKTLQCAGEKLLGGRVIEFKHVGRGTASDGDDAERLTV